MKIALCFFGQPRSVATGYAHFKEHLLDVYDVDVHAHLWSTGSVVEFVDLYKPVTLQLNTQINFKIPNGVYGAHTYGAEPHPDIPAYARCAFNSLSQAYSFYQVCKSRTMYSQTTNTSYDLVIKARTDTAIYSLDMSAIERDMYNVPNSPGGFIYNDVIAFCSETIADVVGFKYEKLEQWYLDGVRDFIPESLNDKVLRENNIPINPMRDTHINLIGYF